MSSDSQGRFTSATKTKIRKTYRNRCAICLMKLTKSGSHCTHLLDSAGVGAKQVDVAVDMGVLLPGYKRSSAENGMIQCPTCHLAFFTSDHIVLSPPPQVLKYIAEYLWQTNAADRKPLHEVFRLLNDAVEGLDVDLPDLKSVLPFLGLYTLVILLPEELDRLQLVTHHLPNLSILDGSQFISAPTDTLPDAPGVARIFDVLAITDTLPEKYCRIPLSPYHTEFTHQRYWRLPAKPEVALMMLMERIRAVTDSGCEEINHARLIYGILLINKAGVDVMRLPSGGKRTAEDHADDEPPHKQSRGETGEDSAVEKGKSGLRTKAARRTAKSPRPSPRRKKARRLGRLKI